MKGSFKIMTITILSYFSFFKVSGESLQGFRGDIVRGKCTECFKSCIQRAIYLDEVTDGTCKEAVTLSFLYVCIVNTLLYLFSFVEAPRK